MALSMDEQRVLAEIERRLAAEEPALAACMTSFRRPGPALMFRSPRAKILGSLFTVALVAVISLMVYAMMPIRGHVPRPSTDRNAGQPTLTTASGGPGAASVVPRVVAPRSAGKGTSATAKPVMGGTDAAR